GRHHDHLGDVAGLPELLEDARQAALLPEVRLLEEAVQDVEDRVAAVSRRVRRRKLDRVGHVAAERRRMERGVADLGSRGDGEEGGGERRRRGARHVRLPAGARPSVRLTAARTASMSPAVSFPVKVFCWDGWY